MSDNKQKGVSPTVLPEYNVDKTPFSWDKLDGLLAYKASLTVCEEILGVHQNTIKNHINSPYCTEITNIGEIKVD